MRPLLASLLVAASVPLASAAESGYARPEMLVEPVSLSRPAVAAEFVVLDVRKAEAYGEGHVPGALRVDHDAWKEAFGDGKDSEGWSRRIGALGIAADSKVVLYDDVSNRDAARIWWILKYWGVEDVRLLNGGWKAWLAAGLPVGTEETPAPKAVEMKARPHRRELATRRQILRSLKEGGLQVVDTRSEAEYCGTDLKGNQRGGAIPGAKHLEWSELIDGETGRFKSAGQLRDLFEKSGVDLKNPIASHCQSGGRASVMDFALKLMGAKESRNYYPGWSEWGNLKKTPIVKPETPDDSKDPPEKTD